METLWIVLILLVATRLCGAIAAKLDQPVLVGEILAGVAIGLVSVQFGGGLAITANDEDHHLMALADLGIFFLMLLGGFEMRPRDLAESSREGFAIALFAMLLPLIGGFFIGWQWLPQSELKLAQALFIGTALAITAVPVTIRVFHDFHMLKTHIGKVVISAAVFDDLLSLILLSVLIAIINTGELPGFISLGIIGIRVLAFLLVAFIAGQYLMKPLARFIATSAVEQMPFSFLLLMGIALALVAELLGLHFILGAFAAGLFFGKHTVNKKVYKDLHVKLSAITSGFLAPIFFASIGLQMDLSALLEVPGFFLLLTVFAFLGKLVGAAIPAIFSGNSIRDAGLIGMAMNARGAVGLIVAGIALDAGLFAYEGESALVENLFSTIVLVVIVTTIITPLGMRLFLRRFFTEEIERTNRIQTG